MGFAVSGPIIKLDPQPTHATQTLVLVGASVRAAAQSARRAGFDLVAIDLFADVDLQAISAAIPVRSLPLDVRSAAESVPPSIWSYTGALENYPALVDQVSRRHILCGNPGPVLLDVRDPLRLANTLRSAGLDYPPVLMADIPPASGTWLSKPRRSCGGSGIDIAGTSGAAQMKRDPRDGGRYLQRLVAGTACSAVFVAAEGRAILMGISQQLIGPTWCGASGFQYAGSLGPLDVSNRLRRRIASIGTCLAEGFSLRGIFGVDLMLNGDQVWTIEVNPRYSASVEILERASEANAMTWHLEACLQGRLHSHWPAASSPLHGKAIIFARRPLVVSNRFFESLVTQNDGAGHFPGFGDVPRPGMHIEAGHPIVTVFATARGVSPLMADLQRLARWVYAQLETS